jgi:citronellol/citronellal dehydrogenase
LIENRAFSLTGKTLFITGASRGIGLAIALRAARDGANVVIAAKTDTPHRRLPGTIHTAAAEIEAAGGRALPLAVDVRFEDQVYRAAEQAVGRFGGIDILVNNASAISLTGTLDTPMKRYDLMMEVNARGTFLCSQACLPYLKKAANPHILTLSPPLDMRAKWFAPHLAYTMAKYGMSMCVLGMAEEFREAGIAVNALWPRTIIATAALQVIPGADPECGRTPEIMADAAWHILTREKTTGNFFIDDEVLATAGITDLTGYAVAKGKRLRPDLFVDDAR